MTQQEFSKRYVYDASTDELGGGGFAHVYKAWDNEEECFVALKIQPVDSRYPDLRLKNEVDRAASLRHPNVARYKACYTFSTFDGNKDIAVMSYYEHGSLDKLLCSQHLTDAEREDILEQILAGVDYLHSQGIIHRDLKPQNILVLHHGGRYVPKITDFGISKQLADGESSAVHNSILGGTYSYASPEQLKETTIRKNTDLWSFGVIAYQMFAGVLPFNCGTFSPTSQEGRLEQFRQMTSGVLPEALNNIPEPWQTLIRECLVVDNTQRLTHVEDCVAILNNQPEDVTVGESTIVETPMEVEVVTEPVKEEVKPRIDTPKQKEQPKSNIPTEPTPKNSKWWLWLLLLLIAVGGFVGYMMLGDNKPEPTQTSSTGGKNVVNADSLRAIERQDSLRRVEELEQRRLDSLRRVDRERFVRDSIRERRRLDSLNRVDAASLRLNSSSVDVSYDGGSNSVSYRLENSLDYLKVECTTNKSWITDIKSSNNKISFTVKANGEYKSRSGIITVDYGTNSYSITVKQAARPAPTFTLSKSSLTVDSSGGSHSVGFTIENPIDGESVSVSDNQSWITNLSASGGKITFKTTDNTSTESRTGTITATYNGITRQISITQDKGVRTYSVGDYYNENGKRGVVFEVWDDGRHGKIISLDETQAAWDSRVKWDRDKHEFAEGTSTYADSESDGKANTDKIMARSDSQYFDAFEWCRAKGSSWYLPALNELVQIYNNKDKLNSTLSQYGTALSDDYVYWSSTERVDYYPGVCAWLVDMSYGYTYRYKSLDYYVRAVSAF